MGGVTRVQGGGVAISFIPRLSPLQFLITCMQVCKTDIAGYQKLGDGWDKATVYSDNKTKAESYIDRVEQKQKNSLIIAT